MTDIGFVIMEGIENCMTEETIMPMSCKCILNRMVFKGAMTKEERDKIVRNLKTQNEGKKSTGKLIDVDAFKARISAGLVYQGSDVLEALDEQPAIEERKGKWIFGETMSHPWMKCSECCKSQDGQTLCFTYCPSCGAKMEVDE